jgi:hypothetical protein
MILATASATLIGAMFVVVSIGSGFLTRDRVAGIRAFLTSTVTHLSTALFGALLTMVPGIGPLWFSAIVIVAGVAGLGYSLHAALGFRQHQHTVLSDFFWYMILPLVGYLLLVAAAASAFAHLTMTAVLFAVALALMLLAGIRNAWDMIVFLVTMDRNSG